MAAKFERFTKRARRALTLAQDEALRLKHNYIGTEHLLLGLVREEDSLAVLILRGLEVDLDRVREQVERAVGTGQRPMYGKLSLTPRIKRVIELAVDEAHNLGHNYIGTEHLLLGLVREGEGTAVDVLNGLGVTLDTMRAQMERLAAEREVEVSTLERLQQRILADEEAISTLRRAEQRQGAQWLYRVAPDEPPPLPSPEESPAAHFTQEIVWTGDEPLIEVKLVAISSDSAAGLAIVLKDEATARYLRLGILSADMQALGHLLSLEPEPEGPEPYDFAQALVSTLGGVVSHAEISGWRDQHFQSAVVVDQAGAGYRVEARPAEAIGFALSNDRPIFATAPLLAALGMARRSGD